MNRTPPTAFGRFDTPRNAAIVAAVMITLAGLAVLLFGAEGTSAVMSVAAVVTAALTLVAVAAAPLIFHLFSFDVADGVDPAEYRAVGTALARIFLIQIFFYGVSALANALLQARRRFFAASWAPVLAPDGTAARPTVPDSSSTSTSTVG